MTMLILIIAQKHHNTTIRGLESLFSWVHLTESAAYGPPTRIVPKFVIVHMETIVNRTTTRICNPRTSRGLKWYRYRFSSLSLPGSFHLCVSPVHVNITAVNRREEALCGVSFCRRRYDGQESPFVLAYVNGMWPIVCVCVYNNVAGVCKGGPTHRTLKCKHT